eukprot:7387007-Prymnesium_polylepis.1
MSRLHRRLHAASHAARRPAKRSHKNASKLGRHPHFAARVARELALVVRGLPTTYASVGVRVYDPVRPAWRLQLAWGLQLALCAALITFLFAVLATQWKHVEAQGTGHFVRAYLLQALLIQAFACEFREMINTFGYVRACSARALCRSTRTHTLQSQLTRQLH